MTGRLILALSLAATLVGCSAGAAATHQAGSQAPTASPAPQGASSAPAGSMQPTGAPGPSGEVMPPYAPVIDPAKFVDQITNPYFPLKPGTTLVYDSTKDDVLRRAEHAVTNETKVIMGVKCLVIRDVLTSNSALVEKTVDWYAQDKDGNVWYFGEDTAEYVNGVVTSTHGTWLAGVDGALPGIVMPAAPKVGDAYRQEYRPGVAEDFAKIEKLDGTFTAPAGTYDKVVVTFDTDLLDKTKLEHKYYASGVGFVGSDGMINGHHEVTKLNAILTTP